jgi:hypothetical protein
LLLNTELLRENKRMLDKAIRELDRERVSLQAQEKKLIVEIKKMAKQNQMVTLLGPESTSHLLEHLLGAMDTLKDRAWLRLPAACLLVSNPLQLSGRTVGAPLSAAGSGEGDGQVPGAKPACGHEDVRAQIAAAGRVAADLGELPGRAPPR